MKGTPESCQSQLRPSVSRFKRLTYVKKTFQTFSKLTAMTLRNLKSGQKLAKAGEDTGIAGKKWGPVGEHVQDVCQGHSRDVYPVAVGL